MSTGTHALLTNDNGFIIIIVIRSAGGEQSIDVSSLPGMGALNQPGSYNHVLMMYSWLTCSLSQARRLVIPS